MVPTNTYIDVAVALPVGNTFCYGVPQSFTSLISVGKRVLVPFGQRRVTGFILGTSNAATDKNIKLILDVLDDSPLFPAAMVPFFQWIADYYKHPIGDVIKTALPGGLTIYDVASIAIADKGHQALRQGSVTPVEKQILECLISGPCRQKDLSKTLDQPIPAALIQSLDRRGRITKTRLLSGGKTKVRTQRHVALVETDLSDAGLSPARQQIIEILKAQREASLKELKTHVPSAPAVIRSLEDEGYVKIISKRVYRDPLGEPIRPDVVPRLTVEQQHVVASVCQHLNNGFTTFLLQGVTGSGKTEVYMQVAADAISKGHSVLVLVPEIALITQMERRFRARFGERIAVLHSGLSAGERFDQWSRILNKEADIAIGARSAIFAPFENIGIIIVDEEHDTSYKQETHLRYNARDLAVVRAMLNNCVALLGSATPSIQSYYNVCQQKFLELTLKERIEKRPLPEIDVVDLRQNRDARGIRRFITSELHLAMKETLARGEQILLFLNRRGFASFPICAACGQAIRCKHCDISLTLHQKANAYKCHYCGFSRASSSHCTVCGSTRIKNLGLGTEKVESALNQLFPEARVARMDRDTTMRKGSILTLLKGIKNKTIDILVGTQMVAKGHDFPNITLVGIICADLSLSFPDFRAGERTFQLLAQVAGRAGRGDVPGRVILQTFNPEHFSILAAKHQDFKTFYTQEIEFRKALNYPPLSRMIQLKISGKDQTKTEAHARVLGKTCHDLRSQNITMYRPVEIMGPIEASLPRIARFYRWQILLKSLHTKALHDFTGRLLADHSAGFGRRDVKVIVDVDPYFMM
ncbi:MAG: primosomal protein N' [Desulfobacterales bacterium]|nr:MAG: primosomal protein N' [Desulfobacterales bacterium]